MNITDILIYFCNSMKPDQCSQVENALRALDGIIAPRFVPNKQQMLVVAYDPQKTGTNHINNTLQSMGFETRLVGM